MNNDLVNAIPNARTSAYSDNSSHQRIDRWLQQSLKYLQLAADAQAQSLRCAKISGDFANKAKKLTKKTGGSWLKVQKRHFAGKAVRTVQDYMKISREWPQLEPVVAKHPNLSIEGALRYLRTGSIEPKRKNGFDPFEFATSRTWNEMIKETWASWTPEERDLLRLNPNRFHDMMNSLRQKLKAPVPTKREFYQELHHFQKILGELTPSDCR